MSIQIKNSLQEEIDRKIADIKTNAMSMSIGELAHLYEHEELEIQPAFQRLYRWDIEQKSNLIESILLGIPLPPIFVQADENGVWSVIDGLQRLSTLFEFMGILKHKEKQLHLVGTKYLPSLEGKKWGEKGEDAEDSLTSAQRMFIKRARIDVNVILKQSDKNAQYEIFQRLNTSGSPLSESEIRNAILLMENPIFHQWFTDLSKTSNFSNLVSNIISESEKEQQYDKELLIRLLVFKNKTVEDLKKVRSFKSFLTEEALILAQKADFSYEKEESDILSLFLLLDNSLGEDAFRRFNPTKNRFEGRFAVYAYEIICFGLLQQASKLETLSPEVVKEFVLNLWREQEENMYQLRAGKNFVQRISNTIEFGRKYFSNLI
ncbi:DUF262 domain-containing protein [Hugenholtzia roseola]|uniref:DUF262 domain-containing protein n=1 Tax=Hugenholtzia roseola TaxID=1002 RepID=UPI0005541875|nr:DUF262 domain-containing protein [Hugenholtzia roseola]